MAKKRIRDRLEGMEIINRRNRDRVDEYSMLGFLEPHMRQRLYEIRAKEIPAANEAARQEIIERYEHDLATWVGLNERKGI